MTNNYECELVFAKIDERAVIPKYAHEGGDACFDIRVLIDEKNIPVDKVTNSNYALNEYAINDDGEAKRIKNINLGKGQSAVFHTGLKCEIPEGYVMKIYPRSSTGIKRGLMLSNNVGIIDSSYRGEIMVALTNVSGNAFESICDLDKLVQGEITKVTSVKITEKKEDELSETERGTGGIGSTKN